MSPTYEVKEVNDVALSRWDAWLEDSSGGGHVLQSYAWGEFKRQFGWGPLRLVLELQQLAKRVHPLRKLSASQHFSISARTKC